MLSDALFSQFVLNAGAVGKVKGEGWDGEGGGEGGGGGGGAFVGGSSIALDWLSGFAAIELSEWNGLCLSFPINQVGRQHIFPYI